MGNSQRAQQLTEQIARRLKVLEEWCEHGPPKEIVVPTSLNRIRCWCYPDRGIEKIGSPSSFTTTHAVHGETVGQIANLLETLHKPTKPVERKKGYRQRLAEAKKTIARSERALAEAANHYAMTSVELDNTKRDLRVSLQSLASSEVDTATLRSENRELIKILTKKNLASTIVKLPPPDKRISKTNAK